MTNTEGEEPLDANDRLASAQEISFNRMSGQAIYGFHAITVAFAILILAMFPNQTSNVKPLIFVEVCQAYFRFMGIYVGVFVFALIVGTIVTHLIRYGGEITVDRLDNLKSWTLISSLLFFLTLVVGCTSAFWIIFAVAEYSMKLAIWSAILCFIVSMVATVKLLTTIGASRQLYQGVIDE